MWNQNISYLGGWVELGQEQGVECKDSVHADAHPSTGKPTTRIIIMKLW